MGRLAYLFAGQGAQAVGMASELQEHCRVKPLFEMAESIRPGILEMMFEGPREDLSQTIWTQPAMFLADLAYAYAREEETGTPSAVCGFSVGEVPALCFAGVLSEEAAFRAILRRAELMEEYTGRVQGGMIAVIGLAPDAVCALCDNKKTHPANFNSAMQTVVACALDSQEAFVEKVKEAGGRAVLLQVSGMFHCPELEPEANAFAEFLRTLTFCKPRMDVYANLTAEPYGKKIVETLSRQMCSPVLFTQTVENMRAAGVEEFIEVGPGKVLTNLINTKPKAKSKLKSKTR